MKRVLYRLFSSVRKPKFNHSSTPKRVLYRLFSSVRLAAPKFNHSSTPVAAPKFNHSSTPAALLSFLDKPLSINDSKHLYSLILKSNIPLSTTLFNKLFAIAFSNSNSTDTIYAYIDHMLTLNIPMDNNSYSFLVRCLVKDGRIEDAWSVFNNDAKKTGVDVFAIEELLDALLDNLKKSKNQTKTSSKSDNNQELQLSQKTPPILTRSKTWQIYNKSNTITTANQKTFAHILKAFHILKDQESFAKVYSKLCQLKGQNQMQFGKWDAKLLSACLDGLSSDAKKGDGCVKELMVSWRRGDLEIDIELIDSLISYWNKTGRPMSSLVITRKFRPSKKASNNTIKPTKNTFKLLFDACSKFQDPKLFETLIFKTIPLHIKAKTISTTSQTFEILEMGLSSYIQCLLSTNETGKISGLVDPFKVCLSVYEGIIKRKCPMFNESSSISDIVFFEIESFEKEAGEAFAPSAKTKVLMGELFGKNLKGELMVAFNDFVVGEREVSEEVYEAFVRSWVIAGGDEDVLCEVLEKLRSK